MRMFIQRVFQTLLGFGLFCLVFFFFKNYIFSLAIQFNFPKLAEAAFDCGVKSTSWDSATTSEMSLHLTRSAKEGHLQIVRLLLDAGLSANSHVPSDDPPLIGAAQNGHSEIVRLLLEKGADVNYQTKDNHLTPLIWAAQNGHSEVVRLLLEKGADVNYQTKDRLLTPLMVAAWKGHFDIDDMLLNQGGDKTLRCKWEWTAFDFAKKYLKETSQPSHPILKRLDPTLR